MERKTTEIYFSTSDEKPTSSSADTCLVFSPCSNPWNDQGFRKLYDLTVYVSEKVHRLERFTRILFEGEDAGYEFVISLPRSHISIKEVSVKFLSQIDSADDFSRLEEVFGRKKSLSILRRIHDASILKSLDEFNENLILAEEKAFRVSLLRSPEAYRAFMNGPGILINPKEIEPPRIELKFRIPRFLNDHEIELDFNSDDFFNNRMAVFVGKNGVGKSKTLQHLVKKVLGETESAVNDKCEFTRVILFSSVACDYYEKKFFRKDYRSLFYRYVNLVDKTRESGLVSAIKAILRGGHSERSKKRRIELLIELLKRNIDFKEILLPVKKQGYEELSGLQLVRLRDYFSLNKEVDTADFLENIDVSKRVVFWNGQDEVFLSAGQDSFANIAGRVMATVEKGSLLIFDEPETYLHPNLEVDLINMLQEILDVTGSFALIATHSVFITREIPRSHVWIFIEKDKMINIARPQIQTFGGSLDQISDYIFGDIRKTKAYEEKLIEKVKSFGDPSDFIKKNKKNLNTNTILFLANLREEDEVL